MRIAVLGDGIAAHLAALMLARAGLPVIRVPVGNGDHGLGPVGDAVLGAPDWQASEIAAAIGWVPGSACALGIAFAGWGADDWFWPFGDTGAPLGGVPFAQVAARVRAAGTPLALADFSLAALAAREERCAPPSADPRSPLATLAVGIAYPVDALAARLAALAAAAGVRVAAPVSAGGIPAADLCVDASGGGFSPGAWESWRAWLPCNRVAVRRTATDRAPRPYPLHTATPHGWIARVGLGGMACETAYTIDGAGTPYENGVRRDAWSGGRVAIGAAAGLIEPALGTALLLAHDAVARLIALLPHDPADPHAEALEYNRLGAAQHEAARDAAVALWATNARVGDPAWDAARDRTPPALARKLALYRSRGRVTMEDGEVLAATDWATLLDGQGVQPRRLDPVAAAIAPDAAVAHCARIHARFAQTVRAMPRHADMLARFGGVR